MVKPEIRLIGHDLDGAEEQLLSGNLPSKLVTVTNGQAKKRFGENYVPNPTNIEVDPTVVVDEPTFIVRAWHALESSDEYPGKMQFHSFLFKLGFRNKEYGVMILEDNESYPLTTREFMVLSSLGGLAAMRSMLMGPPPESPYE